MRSGRNSQVVANLRYAFRRLAGGMDDLSRTPQAISNVVGHALGYDEVIEAHLLHPT